MRAWWDRTGRRHRRAHALTALLLVASVLAQALPANATTCTTSGNDVTIASSCIFDAGTYTFTGTLTINAGVTVTASSNVGSGQVVIVSDNIVVNGTITADGKGFATGSSPGLGGTNAGSGYGGNGGNATTSVFGGPTYGSVTSPTDLGSSGANSLGGGSIKLSAPSGTITIAGSVTASGVGFSGVAAGGSGGSIWIDAGTLSGAGTVAANGANIVCSGCGGGGGGRIAVYYTTDSSTLISGNKINAYGGTALANGATLRNGGAGTVYLKQASATNGDLIVDDNNLTTNANTTQVTTASQTFDNITIRNGSKYVVPDTFTLTAATSVTGGGSAQPLLTTNSGGTFNPPSSSFTLQGLDITNNGAVGTVTALTVGPTATFTQAQSASFSATLSSLTVGNSSSGTFVQTGTGAISIPTVTVNSGGLLTHAVNTTTKINELNLSSTTLTVNSGGSINIDGKGYASGNGPGLGGTNAGSGYGGVGGNATSNAGGPTYGSLTQPTDIGSSGSNSIGGGAVKLVVSGTLTVAGTVTANGAGFSGVAAGGSGGSIWIDAGTISGGGTVTANGANIVCSGCGGGGGGRIAVYYTTDSSTLISGDKINAYGGTANVNGSVIVNGGAGTVYLKAAAATNGDLRVDNNEVDGADTLQIGSLDITFDNIFLRRGAKYRIPNLSRLRFVNAISGTFTTRRPTLSTSSGGAFRTASPTFNLSGFDVANDGGLETVTDLTVTNATITSSGLFQDGCNSLTVGSGGTFSISTTSTFTCTTITVQNGGTLTHNANSTAKTYQADISATTVDVQSGGTISAASRGFIAQNGTGQGTGSNAAAGYGGHGGAVNGGGVTYGSVTNPTDLGSGGRTGSCTGGTGGGAIKLAVSGTLTVNGTVTSNGGAVTGNCGAGAGAGGSVRIDAGTLAGAGTITANGGGNTTNAGGGGGGGRIAVYYTTDTSTLISAGNKITAYGGTRAGSDHAGGAGSVYLKQASATNGDLVVDNNNVANTGSTSTTDQVTTSSQTYDNVTVRNGAFYVIPNTFTLTIPSSGTLTGGGTNQPSLTVNSGGVFNPPTTGTYTFTSIDVTNNGTVNTITNLSLNDSTFVHNGTFGATVTDVTSQNTGTFVVQTTNTFSPTNVTVQSGGALEQRMLGAVSIASLTVQSGGTLTHTANSTSKLYELNLSSTTVDVQASGSVSVASKGFTAQNGTGAPSGANAGAGYGGHGGDDSTGGGVTYGSVTNPTDLGSGGRTGSCTGGTGGGAIKLAVSGTLTVNGTVTANGQSVGGNCGGGSGAGGSVRIDAGTLAGAGTVTANGGGNTTNAGGGGGGGRIAVYYTTDTSTLISAGNKITAYGGTKAGSEQAGGAGTIFLDDIDDALPNGTIIVDNNNVAGTGTASTTDQVATASQTYDNVTVRNGAFYVIPSTFTLTLAGGGALTGGGANQPAVTVSSGGTLDLNQSSLTVTGVDVTNNGTVSDATSLTLNDSTFVHNGNFPAGLVSATAQSGGTFVVQTTTGLSLSTFTAQSGGALEQRMLGAVSIGTVTVENGGTLTHTANSTSKLYELNLSSTTVDVQASGSVSVASKGFTAQNGTGAPSGSNSGAGYGGAGGGATTGPGAVYGSVTNPTDLGSGGRTGSCTGGTGGGAIKLAVSGTLTVNGTVTANGQSVGGNCGGGSGAGGSVRIDAGTLAGGGTVTANGGGNTTNAGGGGGGGRIAVYYTTDTSTLISAGNKITAYGGTKAGSGHAGGAGTVFLKAASAANGDLVVDNNNVAGTGTTSTTDQVATASQTYDNVTIRNGAQYVVPNAFTLALASGGALGGSGTVTPSLTVNTGGALTLPGVIATGTLTLANSGSVGLSGDMNLTTGTFRVTGTISGGLHALSIASGANFINASTSNLFSGSDLTVNGTYTQETTSQLVVGTVIVNSGGVITHADNSTTKTAIVNISATTFTVNAGGSVIANALGFDSSEGTGQGADAATAGGGGYCGAGGNGSTPGAGGTTYGSSSNPDDLGSGGGDDTNVGGQQGGSGGGEIKIQVSGTLTVDGTISANGANGTANEGGGGSGGTVNINAGVWAGAATGVISANGGQGSPTGAGATGGGGGGAGRIYIGYGSKTYSGALTSDGGAKGGATSAATAGANCTPVEQANAPVITSVTHTPSPTATTTDVITLSGSASYATGLLKIEIYLDGTTPSELRHTCNLSGAPTSANCSIAVGTLAYGAHTTTVKAYGTDLSVGTGSENFTIAGSTLAGGPQLSRSKASATGVAFTLSFALQASSSGTLTVTFPAGFTVTQAPSGGGSSACLSAFGSTAQTMTATKTNCTGTVVLAGGQVTNPATPGVYVITWSNDFGSGSVVITDDDQVTVSGEVDPQLTFNVGSQTAACDGTFSGAGGALGLGALTSSIVTSSDVSSVPHVCARVTANAAGGAIVAVRSAFGALQSASTPSDQIASSTSTLVAGTTGYGMCVGSSGGDTGRDTTTPAGATPSAAAPFNGSCTTSAHAVGGLTTSFQSLWSISGPSQNAFARIFLKAAVSPAVPAHADYQDVLTFIATGTY